MPTRSSTLLTAFAAYAAMHPLMMIALANVTDYDRQTALIYAVTAPVILGWGFFEADVALHPGFDERARRRWRVALVLLPVSLPVYWLLQVRPRRLPA